MAYSKQTFAANQILTATEMNQVEENVAQVRKFEIGASAPSLYESGVGWIYNGATPWVFRIAESASNFLDAFHINVDTNEIRPVLPSSATTNSLGAVTNSLIALEAAAIASRENLDWAVSNSLQALDTKFTNSISTLEVMLTNSLEALEWSVTQSHNTLETSFENFEWSATQSHTTLQVSFENFELSATQSHSTLDSIVSNSLSALTNSHEALVSSFIYLESIVDPYSAIFALVENI